MNKELNFNDKHINNMQLSDHEVSVLLEALKLSLWLVDWIFPRVSPAISVSNLYADVTTPGKWILDVENIIRRIKSKTKISPKELPDNFNDPIEILEQYAALIACKKHEYSLRHLMDPINEQTGEPLEFPEDDFITYIYGPDIDYGGGVCRI